MPKTSGKPRRGRPPKPKATRKAEVIKVMVNIEQRKLLEATAEDAGLSLSSWVRSVALKAAHAPDAVSVSAPEQKPADTTSAPDPKPT